MVERLARGPASVSELARPFEMALPTVVQHLGVLAEVPLVTSVKVGQVRTYQLVPGALAPAGDWISRQRGDQTRLTYTEQGVHFDGLDSLEGREEGTRGILDQLGSYLAAANSR
jgi:DNA-binding transcriptional ArsR family regulator